jgi:hypothetical protein
MNEQAIGYGIISTAYMMYISDKRIFLYVLMRAIRSLGSSLINTDRHMHNNCIWVDTSLISATG